MSGSGSESLSLEGFESPRKLWLVSERPLPIIPLPVGVNPNSLFMLWQHFGGDDRRTAAAAGISVGIVSALAHDFQWKDLAQGRLGLKDEKLEREVNRAQNYVQAQRIRRMIDVVVAELEADPKKLEAAMTVRDKDGSVSFSAKPLVELAKAAESAQTMSYRALGDKVATEADGAGAPDAEKIKNLSLTINALVTKASEKLVNPIGTAAAAKDAIDV